MPEIVGSGAALFDFDGDGRLDIYLLQNGGPGSPARNRLFRQGADGRFTDVSAGSGLDIADRCMGVAIGDVNNDGRPDVFVTGYGKVWLFLNNGDGTFADITKEAGLDNPYWGSSACFVDYDRDGWLDLVVVNYVRYAPANHCTDAAGNPEYCGPNAFPGTVTRLFHNLGVSAPESAERGARSAECSTHQGPLRASRSALRAPRFQDVTVHAGLGSLSGPGLGVVCADFNGDHWPDILVANDGKPNHLWINQRNGTFKEEAAVRGIACNTMGQAEANMGIAIGDVDGDGLFDIFATHLTEETHTLWAQGPRGTFRDRTVATGLARPHWRGTGFGTLFADFDHDGAVDLAIANGRVRHAKQSDIDPQAQATLGSLLSRYADRNQLFVNDGKGRFRDISRANEPFCGTARISRGLACGDIDGDGALDLLVTTVAGPAHLYRNVAPKRGHWLLLRVVEDALGGRDAYGAEITVRAGSQRWVRWINPGYSYLCSNDPRAHFGLGETCHLDEIEVVWPDGMEEVFPATEADRELVLRKGQGRHR
jgi:hypothetical protein